MPGRTGVGSKGCRWHTLNELMAIRAVQQVIHEGILARGVGASDGDGSLVDSRGLGGVLFGGHGVLMLLRYGCFLLLKRRLGGGELEV